MALSYSIIYIYFISQSFFTRDSTDKTCPNTIIFTTKFTKGHEGLLFIFNKTVLIRVFRPFWHFYPPAADCQAAI